MQYCPPWQPLEPTKPKKFWLVKGHRGPASHEHESEASARAEARRLALQHPSETFYVCEAIEAVFKRDVEMVSLRDRRQNDDADRPF